MLAPGEFLSRQRWLPARNYEVSDVPPFGVVWWQDVTPHRQWGLVRRPTTMLRQINPWAAGVLGQIVVAVNGATTLRGDPVTTSTTAEFGAVTIDYPAIALFSSAATPGQDCGTSASSYALTPGNQGFRCLGMLDSTYGLVVPHFTSDTMSGSSTIEVPKRIACTMNVTGGGVGTINGTGALHLFENAGGLDGEVRRWYGIYEYTDAGNARRVLLTVTAQRLSALVPIQGRLGVLIYASTGALLNGLSITLTAFTFNDPLSVSVNAATGGTGMVGSFDLSPILDP